MEMVYKKDPVPFLLFSPLIAYLILFMGIPLIQTFILAFTSPQGPWGNFERLVRSGEFWVTLQNTLVITGIIVPLQLILGLALALFVNQRFKGYLFILYIIAIPLALSDVSASLMSYTVFGYSGLLNKALVMTGLIEFPMYFLGRHVQDRAFWVIIITEIWRATPLVFVILLAGLQAVNKEYLEAADIFGFSKWKKFTRIILPVLRPSMMAALLIRTLFAFQIFGVVWVLNDRGIPVMAGEAYYYQTQLHNPNMASAYGLMIALVSVIISWLYLVFFRPKKYEERGGLA